MLSLPWHRLSPAVDPLQLHFLFYSSGPVMMMMVRLIVEPPFIRAPAIQFLYLTSSVKKLKNAGTMQQLHCTLSRRSPLASLSRSFSVGLTGPNCALT